MYCSVLQCVAVYCGVLQCVAVCVVVCCSMLCSVLQFVAVCCSVLQCVAVCCSVLQCVAMCCNVLQRVAMCCIVLHCLHWCKVILCPPPPPPCVYVEKCLHTKFWNKIQEVAVHFSPKFMGFQFVECGARYILAKILKLFLFEGQLSTESAVQNHYRADFWEFMVLNL